MVYPKQPFLISLSLLSTASCLIIFLPSPVIVASSDPVAAPWPLQFHALVVMNSSQGLLFVTDIWYDWPNGRVLHIIQHQLGIKLYDLEWNNGTSYYYTLDADKDCMTRHIPAGIVRPNWLDGANYLGQVHKDGFLCNSWEKVEFTWYYEDVATKRPVAWTFYTGTTVHVMTFEVGKTLDDPNWQAPVYCFKEANEEDDHRKSALLESAVTGLMRDMIPSSASIVI